MPNSSVDKIVWAGTNRPAADSEFFEIFSDRQIVFCDDLLNASEHLADVNTVLYVDETACEDWSRTALSLSAASPQIIRIAYVQDWTAPAGEEALAAGFDSVQFPEGDDWVRNLKYATARARARYRMDAEAEYRGFFERITLPAAILNSSGEIVAANKALVRFLGYSLQEMQENSLTLAAMRNATVEDRQGIRSVLDGESDSYAVELQWRRKDGKKRWVSLSTFRPIHKPNRTGYTFAVVRDITHEKDTDLALQDRESFFESVFTRTAVGISVIQVDEASLRCNPALQTLLGAPEQLSAAKMMELTHPEDRFKDTELFEEMASGERDSYQIEKRYMRQDTGETIHGLLTVSLRRDSSGAPRTIFGTLVDIGNVKEAQRDLAAAEERLRRVLAVSPTVIYTQRVDQRANDSFWASESRQALLGEAEEEEFSQAWIRSRMHPDDLDRLELELDPDAEQKVAEYRIRQDDGSYRWIRDEQRRMRDEPSGLIEIVGSMTDITENKELEAILRLHERSIRELHRICSSTEMPREEKFQRLLEVGCERFGLESGLMTHLKGDQLEVLRANSTVEAFAEGCAYPVSATYCQRPLRSLLPVAMEEVGKTEWCSIPIYEATSQETYLGTPIVVNGETFGTLCFLSESPRSKAFNSSDTDFLQLMAQWIGGELEREQAEKALKESQKQLIAAQKMEAVGRLTGGIAHDFNNLIMAIRGSVHLLLSDANLEDRVKAELFEIDQASDQTRRLVAQLLTFSRKQVIEAEILDCRELVNGMRRMLQRLMREDVSLVLDLEEQPSFVDADRGQLEQVLVNLVVNAHDAISGAGEIRIRTRREQAENGDREVVLSVSDNGSGMDAATVEKIFEPFFTTKEVGKGTGLGLATVYGAIEQLGGRIEVESEVGVGTTFHVYLPRVRTETAEAAVAADENAIPTGNETVLLVEDTDLIRKLTRRMLERAGYKVLETNGGAQALETCQSYPGAIDLLLTDLAMPGMNGQEVAAKVVDIRPEIRVLMMSGYIAEDDPAEHVPEGGGVLQKPVEFETLCRKIRELLDRPGVEEKFEQSA